MRELRNILPEFDTNIGGLDTVFYTPVENVISWPLANGLLLKGDLVLQPDSKFYILGYTRYSPAYEEQLKDDTRGGTYKIEQQGFISSDLPDLGNLFYQIRGGRYILLFKDRNGYLRITPPHYTVGFEYRFSSGDKPDDAPGYKLSFEGSSPYPAFYYSGKFEVSNLGTIKPPTGVGEPAIIETGSGEIVTIPAGGRIKITSGFRFKLSQ